MKSFYRSPLKYLLPLALLILLVTPLFALAQDIGDYQPQDWNGDDGRLNHGKLVGSGLAVYCTNEDHVPEDTYEDDGGFMVLDPEGEEVLFVEEETILEGIETVEETGEYVELGVSERLWYGGDHIRIYLLPSMEFQLNAVNEEGKMDEFVWSECRGVPRRTGDGCRPSWDRNKAGDCVWENLY